MSMSSISKANVTLNKANVTLNKNGTSGLN